MQGGTERALPKAPGWFASTWAVLTIGVAYGMRDMFLTHDEALTALGLAVGWALMRGLFVFVIAKPDRP
jgi:hypothetical protein